MKFKNIHQAHDFTRQHLETLSTRTLIAIRNSSYALRQCCDICKEVKTDGADGDFNKEQMRLKQDVLAVLATREHLIRDTRQKPKVEKKVMAYSR